MMDRLNISRSSAVRPTLQTLVRLERFQLNCCLVYVNHFLSLQRFIKNTFILEKNPTIVNFPVQ